MSFHPSIPGHLNTEIHLLFSLRQRSSYQHRTQPFLRRIDQVLRLSRTVSRMVDQPGLQPHLGSALVKLMDALMTATRLSEQIIELNHFLPLQVSLIGVYSRLYVLVHHMISMLEPKSNTRARLPLDPHPMTTQLDVGTKIERDHAPGGPTDAGGFLALTSEPNPAPRSAGSLRESSDLRTSSTIDPGIVTKKSKNKATKSTSNAMDDIFSLI